MRARARLRAAGREAIGDIIAPVESSLSDSVLKTVFLLRLLAGSFATGRQFRGLRIESSFLSLCLLVISDVFPFY